MTAYVSARPSTGGRRPRAQGGYKLRLTAQGRAPTTGPTTRGRSPGPDAGRLVPATVAVGAAEKRQELQKDGEERPRPSGGGPVRPASRGAAGGHRVHRRWRSSSRASSPMHAGMTRRVKRVTDGVAEPEYAFDVTTTGGSAVRGWPHQVEDLLRDGDAVAARPRSGPCCTWSRTRSSTGSGPRSPC